MAMPARDYLHETVKQALIKDDWTITDDPLRVVFGSRQGFIDMGASKIIGAQKAERKIAVEVKSFIGPSIVADIQQAIGQFVTYRSWLRRSQTDRILYLAIDKAAYELAFEDEAGVVILQDSNARLIVVDAEREEIELWKNYRSIDAL